MNCFLKHWGVIVFAAVIVLVTACDNDIPETTGSGRKPAHIHSWGAWTPTGIEGTEERMCFTNNAHHETRLTGTERFIFEPIGSTAYRIRKNTRPGGVKSGAVIIPDYYRPNAAATFLHVTEIGSAADDYSTGAFVNDYEITAVYIPAHVTLIGVWAFGHCHRLETVTIPEDSHLGKIGDDAFYNTIITGIAIPAGVTEIGSSAFDHCFDLASLTIAQDSRLEKIGRNAFCHTAITGIVIPAGVTEISHDAFRDCKSLASVTFAQDSRLERIGRDAFEATAITGIVIPAGVTVIDERAFELCAGLKTVTFAEGSLLEKIGREAFYKCTALTGIIIPAGVTDLDHFAFDHCYDLETVIFEGDSLLEKIGSHAFDGAAKVVSIIIPEGVTYLGYNVFDGWTLAQTIYFKGFAYEQEANDACNDTNFWKEGCNAKIKYWNGSAYVE